MTDEVVGRGAKAGDDGMLAAIGRAGRSLEQSEKAEDIKKTLVARCAVKAAARPLPNLAHRVRSHLSVLRVPVLARALAAAAAAVLITFSVALASTSAMPGNPLYSVKRLVEKGRLAVTSSAESRAKIEVEQAARRLVELGFANRNSMGTWYYPLVRDAEESFGEARTDAGSASVEIEREVEGEARAIVKENERTVREVIPTMLDDEAGQVEEWLEDEKGEGEEREEPEEEKSESENEKEIREKSGGEEQKDGEEAERGGASRSVDEEHESGAED